MKPNYTREEVIDIIDNALHHADAVMDAITSEDPQYSAEDLLEMVESHGIPVSEAGIVTYCIEVYRELEEVYITHIKFTKAPTREEVLEYVKTLDINYDDNYGKLEWYPV